MPKGINNVQARIASLYSQTLVILTREVKHLSAMSIVEKLPTGPAKDLRDYVKLLGELKQAHEAIEATRVKQAEEAAKAVPEQDLLDVLNGAPKGKP